jgi:hypothetical protein
MTTTRLSRLSVLFSSALLLALVAGCSAASEPADDVETDEAAVTACGSDKYAAAMAHYRNAVQWSKERLSHRVCEWEHGSLREIADEASHAVMTCGNFRETIKSSPWAEPIRTVLAQSLTLRSLTGELLVIKDSQWQNWTGTERFFDQGLIFAARPEGAYGSAVRIEFKANGTATWGYLYYDEPTGEFSWRTQPATYTITKIDGTEKGKRRVSVTHGGKTESFTLGVDAGYQYKNAPIFTLVPESTAPGNAPKLYSLVHECDA